MKTIGESLYIAVGRGPGPVWAWARAAAVRVVTCNHPFRIGFGGGGGGGERDPASSEWHPLRSTTTLWLGCFGVASDLIRLRHLPLPASPCARSLVPF
uniref:Uncharacterized protein n=1 Tax=Oryza meridionalis TaxID=40149 RepID=A0A0E0CW02_9ORYZ